MNNFEDLGPVPYILPRENQVDPILKGRFGQMAQEFFNLTGQPLKVTDSFRSDAEQADVYQRKPGLASPPGKSRHNVGGITTALDLDTAQIPDVERLGLLGKYGFVRPVLNKGETWHIELPRGDFQDLGSVDFQDLGPVKPAAGALQAVPAAISEQRDTISQAAQPGAVQSEPESITDTTSATLAAGAEPAGEMIAKVLGLPHEAASSLLGLAGVPEHQVTDMEALMRSGEFGQVGGPAVEGQVDYPLREVMATMLDPLSYYGTEKGLTAAGRLAGLRLPRTHGATPTTEKIPGAKVFKEPEIAAEDWLSQIKTRQAHPLAIEAEISEIVAANKPVGVIPAAKTTLPPAANLPEKYGAALAEKTIRQPYLGKYDFNITPSRNFDRLEDFYGMRGIKEDIYWRQADLSTASKLEYKAIDKASRELESGLPSGSGETIYDYAVTQQEGGVRALQAAKRGPVIELSPEQMLAHEQMRAGYDSIFKRLNEARVAAGKEALAAVDDYTPFIRQYFELVNEGGNPVTANAIYFKPATTRLPYEIPRTKSGLPIGEMNAFKTYRRYMRSVLDYVYEAPFTGEVRELANTIRKNTGVPNTGTAQFLDGWVDQVMGVKRHLLFGSSGHTPTNIAERVVDSAGKTLLGIKPITAGADATISKVISNIGNSTLSGLFRTAFVQPFSTWLTYSRVGLRHTIGGLKDALSPEGWRLAKANSSKIHLRTPDVSMAMGMEKGLGMTATDKAIAAGTEAGFTPTHFTDQFAAEWAWHSGRRDGLARGLSGKELNRHADDIMISTQGSAARGDRAMIQTHTGGQAATMYQTFIINEWSHFWRDMLGIKNPRVSGVEALKRTGRAVASAAAVNSLLDYVGINTPLPDPIAAAWRARNEGKLSAAWEGVKSLSQIMPVFGGSRYTGGSPLGPAAQFAGDAMATLRGDPSRLPLWSLPLRLRGVPGTVQLERLTRVPGKLSLGEALFGKMQAEKPMAVPRRPSRKQVLEGQSYIKDLFPDLDLGF